VVSLLLYPPLELSSHLDLQGVMLLLVKECASYHSLYHMYEIRSISTTLE
jgi:hypothetical protein